MSDSSSKLSQSLLPEELRKSWAVVPVAVIQCAPIQFLIFGAALATVIIGLVLRNDVIQLAAVILIVLALGYAKFFIRKIEDKKFDELEVFLADNVQGQKGREPSPSDAVMID